MISLLGQLTLITALSFAILQGIAPLYGIYRKNHYALALARPAALGQFAFVLMAYTLLTVAFAIDDFSIRYVAENSHPDLPKLYKLTAVWGAHEGSILFWILVLNCWTLVPSFIPPIQHQDRRFIATAIAIIGIISIAFLSFLLLTSNPFLLADTLTTGQDLNPLLQDPGFVMHPPMLYIGYVGFAVTFALTKAALLNNRLDSSWTYYTKQFAIAAWAFLTLGITLGSWWAYRVLGWGGFWFWDPVENASLLPWLAGTALIRILILVEKRQQAIRWGVILAIITFTMSLLGTFLVRSGVLISAHTFASDPARGVFLLILLGLITSAAMMLFFSKLKLMPLQTSVIPALLSRETALLLNSILLFFALLIILLGTLYPLFIDAFHLGALSVGPPYFNQALLPLLICLLCLMTIGPLCRYGLTPIKPFSKVIAKSLALSLIIACLLYFFTIPDWDITAFIVLTLSLIMMTSLTFLKPVLTPMSITHGGFAMLVIGIVLSGLLSLSREVRMSPGDTVTLGPYQFLFIDTRNIQGENYKGIQAAFEVTKSDRHITNLYPEKRLFSVREMVMTKVDIHPGIFRDLYLALGEPLAGNAWSVRLYYKPFIRWIWIGGMLMLIGGLFALFSNKKPLQKRD